MKRLKISGLTVTAVLLLMTNTVAWGQAPGVADLPPGKGRDLVASRCASCHALSILSSKPHNPDEWSEVVEKMVQRGAKANDDEMDIMVDYLSKNIVATGSPRATSN